MTDQTTDQPQAFARQVSVRICRRCGAKIDDHGWCSVGCPLDECPDVRPPDDVQTLIYRYVGTEAEIAQRVVGDGASLRARLAALVTIIETELRLAREEVESVQVRAVFGEPDPFWRGVAAQASADLLKLRMILAEGDP